MGLERYLAYEELSKEKLQNHLNDRNKKIDLGFEMTLAYEIKHKDPAIKIKGDTVINPCELFTLVSLPGAGKTNISEVIITCHIAASNEIELPDNFGIEVFPRGKKCLLIDTERPYDDNRVSLGRICKRLNIKTNSHLVVNDKLKDLTFRVFTELHELAERKAALAKLISSGEYEFVILDGVLDFVPGLNEEVEVGVHITLKGDAEGLKTAGAILLHPTMEIQVRCKVSDIVDHFDYEIASLDVDGVRHASDITLPPQYILVSDPKAVVAAIHIQKKEEEAEAVVVEGEGEGPEVVAEGKEGAEPASAEDAKKKD